MMLLTFFVLCCYGGHLDTEESFDLCLVAGEVVGPAPSNRHYSHDDIPSLKVFEFMIFFGESENYIGIIYTCEQGCAGSPTQSSPHCHPPPPPQECWHQPNLSAWR